MTDTFASFEEQQAAFLRAAAGQADFFKIRHMESGGAWSTLAALVAGFSHGLLRDERRYLLLDFIKFAQDWLPYSKSQIMQDLFAAYFAPPDGPGRFMEFGAGNGRFLSNTWFLERHLGWTGALSEPSRQWYPAIVMNRRGARIITDCIWTESGKELEFYEAGAKELSTLRAFVDKDRASHPDIHEMRTTMGYTEVVRSLSLNDAMELYFEGVAPDYLSVDTEGSEYDILAAFDWTRYRPRVLTVEHNFTEAEAKLDGLMANQGYARVFRTLTAFDAWYVRGDLLLI